MSQETMTWLNTNTLIGMTSKRGTAWHYRAVEQGDESNHYPHGVPVDDVLRRLFNFTADTTPEQYSVPVSNIDEATGVAPDGTWIKTITDPDFSVTYHSVTHKRFGVFKTDTIHQYDQWLLNNLAKLVTPTGLAASSDTMVIGSAGLLKEGALAWVQIELPDTVKTPEGFDFRPYLLGASSHNGQLSTTYGTGITAVVCDNTLTKGLLKAGRSGHRHKVKRSSKSLEKLEGIQETLGLLVESADDFAAEVAALARIDVSDRQFTAFVEGWSPLPDATGAARTRAEGRRDELINLWNNDNRVAPWKNTALGVVQGVNTYNHHVSAVRGNTTRATRNMTRAVTGEIATKDEATMGLLNKILATV